MEIKTTELPDDQCPNCKAPIGGATSIEGQTLLKMQRVALLVGQTLKEGKGNDQ
jgi:hypothetical protein